MPLADRVLGRDRPGDARGPRRGLPGPAARPLRRVAEQLGDDVVVIDCGADHRLTDPAAWTRWYGGAHAGAWPYGLPELPGARDALRGARRVAVPGCYPTAASLALFPAFAAGWPRREVVVARSAARPGRARSLKPHLLGAEVMGSAPRTAWAGPPAHPRDRPEPVSGGRGDRRGVASPRCSRRCRAASSPLHGADAGVRGARCAGVRQGLRRRAVRAPAARGRWPSTAATLGANTVHLQVTVDADAGRLVAVAAIDNLTKGTAGAAVQCMNLALGLPETTGLPTTESRRDRRRTSSAEAAS